MNTQSFTIKYNNIARILVSAIEITRGFDIQSQKKTPGFRRFYAIWDTGASSSVITKRVAQECKLKPTSMARVQTAGGEFIKPDYWTSMALPNNIIFPFVQVTEGEIGGQTEVLVGMDIISKVDLAITNTKNKTVFSFRVPSLSIIDFVKEEHTT